MANLRITDNDSNTYDFPDSFWITEDTVATNKNVVNQFYAPGGRDIADRNLLARTITITGTIQGNTLAEFETKYRAFNQAVLKGGQLSKTVDFGTRYITVKSADINPGQEMGQQLRDNVNVTFLAEFPFWEDTTQSVNAQIISIEAKKTFTVTVSATQCDYAIYPIIEISADQAAALPGIKLTQLSDGGAFFVYNDPLFAIGDIAIIDCGAGTVKRNNNNTIQYFITPRFLRLLPGINNFVYEGNFCTITFSYRKVYV